MKIKMSSISVLTTSNSSAPKDFRTYIDTRLNKTLNQAKKLQYTTELQDKQERLQKQNYNLCILQKILEARSVYSALYFWQWGVLNDLSFVKSDKLISHSVLSHTGRQNHYRLCVWPGLCTVQSLSSSSVTTVSWAVFRLSSSAVGSTISMELRGEHVRVTKEARRTECSLVFFLSWAGRSFTYSSKTQKEALTGCLWICSPRVFAKFTSGVSVLMVTSGSFAVGSRETEVSVVDFFMESRKNSLTESGCMHYGTIMYYQAGNEYWSIIGKKTQYIATKTNNCRVFISVSVRVIAVTSHTVLQGSQQGNGTSVQQVPVVVETHQVAVEHPAELQPEPAESGPTMGTAIQRDQWTSASPHLPFLFRCTGPPFVSLQSCNTNMNITQLTHSGCCCEMETMYIKVSRTFRLHRPQTGWRPAPARLVVPAESERNTEEAGPRWALNRDGESTAVSLCLSIKLLHHHKAASLTQHLYI